MATASLPGRRPRRGQHQCFELTQDRWAGNVLDLQRVLSAVFSLYLLLQQHNEAVLRVALELLTCNSCQQVLTWDLGAWYSDHGKREWFKAAVKEKLDHVLRLRRRGLRGSSDAGATGQHFRKEGALKTCPACSQALASPAAQAAAAQMAEAAAIGDAARAAAEARAASLERQLLEVQAAAAAAVARAAAYEAQLLRPQGGTTTVATDASPAATPLDADAAAADARRCIAELERALNQARQEAAAAEARAQAAEEENRHLKVAAEELKAKMKKMLKRAEESGDTKLRELVEDTGLGAIVNTKNVWDRLYDEAMERIERMNELRRHYKAKNGVDPLEGVNFLEALSGSELTQGGLPHRGPLQQGSRVEQDVVVPELAIQTLGILEPRPAMPTDAPALAPQGKLHNVARRVAQHRKVVRCLVGAGTVLGGEFAGAGRHLAASASGPELPTQRALAAGGAGLAPSRSAAALQGRAGPGLRRLL